MPSINGLQLSLIKAAEAQEHTYGLLMNLIIVGSLPSSLTCSLPNRYTIWYQAKYLPSTCTLDAYYMEDQPN